MLVAVMSDSHDNIWNLRRALDIVRRENAAMIVHCGDFVAPFTLKELDSAGVPVHGVFGNNDGDQYLLTRHSLTILSNVNLHGLVGRVDAGGFAIGFTHYRQLAEGMLAAGGQQLVCFGHSHEYFLDTSGSSVLLNPGEIMGKDGHPGFCLVDTHTAQVRRIALKG